MTSPALEALLVPNLVLRKYLVSVIDKTAAPWAALAFRSCYAAGWRIVTISLELSVTKLLSGVGIESSSPPTKPVPLRTEFSSVANLAVKSSVMFCTAGAVQHLVAH